MVKIDGKIALVTGGFLRRFAPASVVDAGIRKDLRLDAPMASQVRPGRLVQAPIGTVKTHQ